MDIIERMAATEQQVLGWKQDSAVDWGTRLCSGVSCKLMEMGQAFERLRSDLR